MSRVGRILFHLSAALSLMLLALLAWLCLGDGSVVTAGRFAAGREEGDVFFLMSVVQHSNADWERSWQGGGVSVGRVRSPHNSVVGLAFIKMPWGLALPAASVVPASWAMWRFVRRRRSAQRELDEERRTPAPSDRPGL